MKKIYKICLEYTDTPWADRTGFEHIVYWRFENCFMNFLTFGWNRSSKHFINFEKDYEETQRGSKK